MNASTPTTPWPRSSSASARCDPTNPATPVTRTRMTRKASAWRGTLVADADVVEPEPPAGARRRLDAELGDLGRGRLPERHSDHLGDERAVVGRQPPVVGPGRDVDGDGRPQPRVEPVRDRRAHLRRARVPGERPALAVPDGHGLAA